MNHESHPYIFSPLLTTGIATAGTGGYFSRTCVSISGRTVFIQAGDDFGEQTITRLIIDGAEATYNFADADTEEVGDDGYIDIQKNGIPQLEVSYSEGGATLTIHQDPCKGTWADTNAHDASFDVVVRCQFFYQEP